MEGRTIPNDCKLIWRRLFEADGEVLRAQRELFTHCQPALIEIVRAGLHSPHERQTALCLPTQSTLRSERPVFPFSSANDFCTIFTPGCTPYSDSLFARLAFGITSPPARFLPTRRSNRGANISYFLRLKYPIRSSTALTISGSATVASSKTSAKRPPSSGGTNFPQETASV
jgi:hypothetical protein